MSELATDGAGARTIDYSPTPGRDNLETVRRSLLMLGL